MGKTLTFVAQPLKDKDGKESEDFAIEAIWAKLDRRTDQTDHHVHSVATLQEIDKALRKFWAGHPAQPAEEVKIQIIGHGSPGKLRLSGDSTKKDAKPPTVFVLDSNPLLYSVLRDCVMEKCKVLLFGCTVGAESNVSRVADGPTLLFDLARMWNCKVGAPMRSVGVDDLDPEGIFPETRRDIHVAIASQLRILTHWDEASSPVPDPEDTFRGATDFERLAPPVPGQITLTGLRGLPLIGIPSFSRAEKQRNPLLRDQGRRLNTHLRKLSSLVGAEVKASSVLATAELHLSLLIDGRKGQGEIIVNNTLLRVRGATSTRYFELEAGANEVIRTIVGKFVPR